MGDNQRKRSTFGGAATVGGLLPLFVSKPMREFKDQRVDESISPQERVVRNQDLKYSKFEDAGTRDTTFEGCDFSFSVFTRAYFHKCTFENCKFIGVHFIDCNLRQSSFHVCDFDYARFRNSIIPTSEIISNAPKRENVRRELMQILRVNALALGDTSSANQFIKEELSATRTHNKLARDAKDSYYKKKYSFSSNSRAWFAIRVESIQFWLNGLIWGHGEYLSRLIISIFSCLIFYAVLVFVSNRYLREQPGTSVFTDILQAITFTVSTFLGASTEGLDVKTYSPVVWLILFTRYIGIGLFATMLFRRITRR